MNLNMVKVFAYSTLAAVGWKVGTTIGNLTDEYTRKILKKCASSAYNLYKQGKKES